MAPRNTQMVQKHFCVLTRYCSFCPKIVKIAQGEVRSFFACFPSTTVGMLYALDQIPPKTPWLLFGIALKKRPHPPLVPTRRTQGTWVACLGTATDRPPHPLFSIEVVGDISCFSPWPSCSSSRSWKAKKQSRQQTPGRPRDLKTRKGGMPGVTALEKCGREFTKQCWPPLSSSRPGKRSNCDNGPTSRP